MYLTYLVFFRGGGYYLEEQEERYQSMYDGKSYGENEFPLSQYETLQVRSREFSMYESTSSLSTHTRDEPYTFKNPFISSD